MLDAAIRRAAEVGLCGTRMDVRGIRDDRVVEGARRSTLDAHRLGALDRQGGRVLTRAHAGPRGVGTRLIV
jgi:hypothetical protein